MLLLLDANVIYCGIVGRASEASAVVFATILLGGFEACTIDNAMDEARRHLIAHFNENRLKITWQETDRELNRLRAAPTFAVHPWINPQPGLLADNPKDAYLLAAIDEHRPTCLLTFDNELLALGSHAGAQIVTPELFLSQLDALS